MTRAVHRWAAALVLGGLAASVASVSPAANASPLGDAKQRAAQLRHQVDSLQEQAEIATEAYDEAYARLSKAVSTQLSAQTALQEAQNASTDDGDTSARRARALYISGGATALYASVLSSGDITAVTHTLRQVQAVLSDDASSVRKANASVQAMQTAQKSLDKAADAASALQKTVSDRADRVRGLLDQTTALLNSADKQVRDIADAQRRAAEAAAAARAAAALANARVDVGTLPDVPASPLATAALAFAKLQLGKPYVWGATGPDSYDCSGLTGASYAAAGLVLPRTSREQWFSGPHVGLAQLEPGDLLFWAHNVNDPASIHHVALYAGNGLMVAAPHTGDVVRVQPIYLDGFIGAVRPGLPTSAPTTLVGAPVGLG